MVTGFLDPAAAQGLSPIPSSKLESPTLPKLVSPAACSFVSLPTTDDNDALLGRILAVPGHGDSSINDAASSSLIV